MRHHCTHAQGLRDVPIATGRIAVARPSAAQIRPRVRSVRSRLAVVIDEALGGLPEIAIKSAAELERALERSW